MWPISFDSHWLTNALAFAVAFGFGFVLERSGFGDSRRLAAQFYLHEMRVLKVMFTAIVTAMLLLFWSVSLGLLELPRIFVNPTYLGSGIVGGLVLGAGFIIGGYCPGTSLVSAATGKIDGMFFVGGVAAGILVFGESFELVRGFFEHAGDYGRWQLFDLFGVDAGIVVAGVVLMALFMFWGAERLERAFADRRPEGYES